MTNAAHSSATLSGRDLARQRRAALATQGRAALSTVSTLARRLQATAAAEAATAAAMNTAEAGGCGCGCNGAPNGCGQAQTAPAYEHKPAQSVAPTGRALARARREALARDGKSGLQRVAQATRIAATMPDRDWQTALQKGATGRQLAMQRRMVLSLTGRSTQESSSLNRPAGRVRPSRTTSAAPAPSKVEESHTLAGQLVTGTQVERSQRVTGNEPGTCRSITGTEYIGQEQYEAWCGTKPQPRPSKIGFGATLMGQPVSGSEVGRSEIVTGDEAGACRSVTGDQYLGSEHFDRFCETRPQPEASKVIETQTQHGQAVTGSSLLLGNKITGNEIGSCRGITGTQYLSREDHGLCSTTAPTGPHKVSIMSTRREQTVSGTAVSRSEQKVTGGEAGAARPITGSQYALSHTGEPGIRPGAATRRGSSESVYPKHGGDGDLRSAAVTVMDDNSWAHRVAAANVQFAPTFQPAQQQPASYRTQTLTGDIPGTGGGRITGDERGACEPVTGTAYVGPDNLHASCTISSRWLTRFPEAVIQPEVQAPEDFSIQTPARQAWNRRQQAVTGSAMDSGERITGPGNKASGLITGTPEFRHGPSAMTGSMGSVGGSARGAWRDQAKIEAAVAEAEPASRLTGDGSQDGIRVTGDAWGAGSRVTGTEGPSARSRNPSQRGTPRGAGTHARAHMEVERQELPLSKITGSAGNTSRGAVITVSGGARG